MAKIPVWIDTDCGVDDALALICACGLNDLEIVGISTGVGTTLGENTFRNARNVLNLINRTDIKVYRGADASWVKEYAPAPAFHGQNGLGDVEIAESDAPIESKAAWDAMYEAAKKYEGKLKIAPIGQLTNLANAIIKYPDFIDHVDEVAFMGGAINGGNTTLCAEANIYRDPHAAECVFKSGINLTMFGLDATEKAYLTKEEMEEIRSYGSKVSDFIYNATRIAVNTNKELDHTDNYTLHDLCPLIYFQYPEYFKGQRGSVYVETRNGLTSGKTVSDIFTLSDNRLPKNDVLIMLESNRDKIAELVTKIYRQYS